MQYLVLLLLACVVAASAAVLPAIPYGYEPFVPPIPQYAGYNPDMSIGKEYVDQGFSRGSGGSHGSAYQNQGSNSYYDHGQKHNRVKQVLESENSSSHTVGGSSQGSSAGQSGGKWSSYGDGHLRSGGEYAKSGYFV